MKMCNKKFWLSIITAEINKKLKAIKIYFVNELRISADISTLYGLCDEVSD